MKTAVIIILALISSLEAGYILILKANDKIVRDNSDRWTITLDDDDYFEFSMTEHGTYASLMSFEGDLVVSSGNRKDQAVTANVGRDNLEVITHLENRGIIKDTDGDGIPECKAVWSDERKYEFFSSVDTIWEPGKQKCCCQNQE